MKEARQMEVLVTIDEEGRLRVVPSPGLNGIEILCMLQTGYEAMSRKVQEQAKIVQASAMNPFLVRNQ